MHIEDWYDEGTEASIEEIEKVIEDFNNARTYNPYGWLAWMIVDGGDLSVYVESEDGKFIARFANSPAEELTKFMERLEEGLE